MSTTIYLPLNDTIRSTIINSMQSRILAENQEKLVNLQNELNKIIQTGEWVKIKNKKVYYITKEKCIVPDIIETKPQPIGSWPDYERPVNWNSEFEGFSGIPMSRSVADKLFDSGSPFAEYLTNESDSGDYLSLTILEGGSWYKCGKYGTFSMSHSYKAINVPVFRLEMKNTHLIKGFITENLIPTGLESSLEEFMEVLIDDYSNGNITLDFDTDDKIIISAVSGNSIMGVKLDDDGIRNFYENRILTEEEFCKDFADIFLQTDTRRTSVEPYDLSGLTDIMYGSWEIKTNPTEGADEVKLVVDMPLTYRDPCRDVCLNGTVGIDFGTRSTVVGFYSDTADVRLMRVGQNELSKAAQPEDYENPTIMEFINLESFLAAYNSAEGRPETCWEDLKVSHPANTDFNDIKAEKALRTFYSYFYDIKQWCGDTTGKRSVKIIDRNGTEKQLGIYAQLKPDDFDPVELYAYYLGLFINRMNKGVFLDYVMSFPVTYENNVREKILSSFEKGLKKSLPVEVLKSYGDRITVRQGASEPAAYAVCALGRNGYSISPMEGERIFYGIFDMGGGTTDFDFGILRNTDSNRKREKKYDYVIERFGAGGDMHLGGEKLLELLAYTVFSENADNLRQGAENGSRGFTFTCPEECTPFDGSETLIDTSDIAKRNTKKLCEVLRCFAENLTVEEPEAEDSDDNQAVSELLGRLAANGIPEETGRRLIHVLRTEKEGKAGGIFSDKLKEAIQSVADDAGLPLYYAVDICIRVLLGLGISEKQIPAKKRLGMAAFTSVSQEERIRITTLARSILADNGLLETGSPFTVKEYDNLNVIAEEFDINIGVVLYLRSCMNALQPEDADECESGEKAFVVKTIKPNEEAVKKDSEDAINLETKKITVDLFDRDGHLQTGKELNADPAMMLQVLSDRIERGVVNFFKALMLTEPIKSGGIKTIYIFFAGNATKSPLVENLFYKCINNYFGGELSKIGIDVMDSRHFRLFPPLGSQEAIPLQEEYGAEIITGVTAPTGKTGVVRGLLDSTVLVLDSIRENGVPFMYFLGENRCGKFIPVIRAGSKPGEWMPFIDACDSMFMLYYTSQPECIDGNMPINRVKLKKLGINHTSEDDDVNVYIRLSNSNMIEYCVARDGEVKENKFLCSPEKVILD